MNNLEQSKECYRQLCAEKETIPLFMQAWWMEAVSEGKNWNVIFSKKNDCIVGVLVYHYVTKFGFKFIVQPQLTQYNGIWIDYPENLASYKRLSLEKEVISDLIAQLESRKFVYYSQNFHCSVTNWLPFYWKNFRQTTRYTYQIKDISNPDKCFEQFVPVKKQHISKAEKHLSVDYSMSGEEFYSIAKQNLDKSNQKIFYSKNLFLNLYNSCCSHQQGLILAVRDSDSHLHAAVFIVWDNMSAYYLITTISPKFRSSGASSLMVWEAVKKASKTSKTFDFEGSMNENIEHSFRQFGAEQVPYFAITKHNSFLLKPFFS